MTATQPDSEGYTRRGVMRATAVGIGAAAGVGAIGSTARPAAAIDWDDVGKAVGAYAVGGPVIAAGWALREFEVIGSDSPAEGLTADALKQQVYQTVKARESNNASTIVDNENILDGVDHTAYTEAKIAAIEELNAGSAESDVLDAATVAIDNYETTVKKNFLKSWEESVQELQALKDSLEAHSETSYTDALDPFGGNLHFNEDMGPVDHEFPDGSTLTLTSIYMKRDDSTEGNVEYTPLETDYFAFNMDKNTKPQSVGASYDGSSVNYLWTDDWTNIWSDMDTTFQDVRDGISTWVTNVYDDVQSGEIEIDELVTPRERAAMMADEEGGSQALADLIALNIPVDMEREATVTIAETGATLQGSFGLTDEGDGPLESGETYTPSDFSGDVYFTTDISLMEGDWTAFEDGVDGGTITFTEEPYAEMVYNIATTAGETVSVPASDFTETDEGGAWTYDASGDLETEITEVDSVEYAAETDETTYETYNLDSEFTIDSFENTETGEEEDSASFTSTEPQDDENYITEDEWNDLEEQNQELIDKYEESQDTGGGSGGAGGGFFEGESPDLGLIAAVVGAAGVVYALFGSGES